MKPPPQISVADIDRFIGMLQGKLNPTLTPERRADAIHDFVLAYAQMAEPEATPEWAKELARRVRQRALWLKPSS